MSDLEPRRSVRSTKGQHKSLDQLDQAADTKKRGRRAGKKPEEKQDDVEEEFIRCICGATEQDGDPGEPWIACDKCTAWQHNICMGMSRFIDDIPKHYFCEQCKPENHKELLEGIKRGEKPWEEHRRAYEEEKANEKKRKGGRKAKPKRDSETRGTSTKPSPVPEVRKELKNLAGSKRKSVSSPEAQDAKVVQKRRVSEVEGLSNYQPPDDLPAQLADLPDARQPPARGLSRAMHDVFTILQKKGEFSPQNDESVASVAERLAIQIERAVYDEHRNHKEYATQIRTLRFNLKENHELCSRLLKSTLTPPMLAVMTSDDLASKELQQKTAKMRAQAERQSILGSEDVAPRLRRTHKGEEIVEKEISTVASEDKPSVIRRQSIRETADVKGPSIDHSKKYSGLSPGEDGRQSSVKSNLQLDTGKEYQRNSFDINKVFSSVRSPTALDQARIPQHAQTTDGPGVDPEVDRLLQDTGDESPPYSPSEESDPSIVWRGNVAMNNVSSFHAMARHVGGVNLHETLGLPWTTLVPRKLTVAGRIDEQIATEYLCSLRYSLATDIVVASLSPASDADMAGFLSLVDYFTLRKRYGVVGEKGIGNVRDTYLVPIPAGTNSHPEFMLNLEDNFIPASRAIPMLLLVIVYWNDPATMVKLRGPNWVEQYAAHLPTDTSPSAPAAASQNLFDAAPTMSPTSPQTASSQQLEGRPPADSGGGQVHLPSSTTTLGSGNGVSPEDLARREGEAAAKEVLGPLASCTTAGFLMSQAANIKRDEWNLVRTIFENHPQTRDDLMLLTRELERYHEIQKQALLSKPTQTPVPVPRVPHTAVPRPVQAAASSSQSTAAPAP